MKVNSFLARASQRPDVQWDDLAQHIEHSHWTAICSGVHESSLPFSVTAADIWQPLKDKGLLERVGDFFGHMKNQMRTLAEHLKMSLGEIAEAFKSKQVFAFLKAIAFNVAKLLKPLKAFAELYHDGLLKVFAEIHKTKAFQALNSGAMKLDEFLDKYPLLKRLAGPAVAGLLIWMFLAANFTGSPSADMDLTAAIKAAISGSFSVAELFTSPSGIMALTLLLTSLSGVTWMTPMWLDSAVPFNILTALAYTGYKHLKSSPEARECLQKLKARIPFV